VVETRAGARDRRSVDFAVEVAVKVALARAGTLAFVRHFW